MDRYQQSRAARERAAAVIPGGVHSFSRVIDPPLVFTRARGATLWDEDGHSYVDYHAAFAPIILGHNDPAVSAAVRALLEEGDLVGAGTTPLEIALSERVCRHIPSAEKALFTSSGSEATYHAVRLARAVTRRLKILKFEGGYHGWYDAVCASMLPPKDRIGTLHPESAGILPATLAETVLCPYNDAEAVEEAFRRHPGAIAAVIVEPIAHNIGCGMPLPGFLADLRRITEANGSLLIFDEVITGFRYGLGGYQKICGVTPDLTTFGKAMANGYPIGALAGKARLMDRFVMAGGDVFFGGTFNAHPLSLAASSATLDILETGKVYPHTFALAEKARAGLQEIFDRRGIPARVVGYGSVFLTYFGARGPIRNYADAAAADGARLVDFRRRMIDRGFFMIPRPLKRNHVSYAHTEADIARTLEAADEAAAEMTGRAAPARQETL